VILGLIAPHPLQGIGLGGLAKAGIVSTDSTYLQLYGEAGLLAVVGSMVLLLVAGAACLPGLRSPEPATRLGAAAGVTAAIAMFVGGFAYDALRSLSSARPFWALVALGVVATERAGAPVPGLIRRPRAVLIGAVVAAELVAWCAVALAPVHYARQYTFTTVAAERETHFIDPVTVGRVYIHTVCGAVAGLPSGRSEYGFDCRDLTLGAGVGELRVEAPSAAAVATATDQVKAQVARTAVSAFDLNAETPVQRGRGTLVTWAPLWLPVAVLLALLLVPVPIRRTRAKAAS
jgi:hypothetical protein